MKIVVDENIPLVEAFFGSFGDIKKYPGRQIRADDVHDADALLVRSVTPVDAALVDGSRLSFVGTCTIGTDHINATTMAKNNISWSSAPGCNAQSVVEYVYAALCALDVNWQGKRFGIIGCGNVGGQLYRRLKAQGIDCYCYDPFLTAEQNADLTTLEAVLACDIISMHTPLTLDGPYPSFHLVGEKELDQLQAGAVLLSCGRGAVIDNQALLAFLKVRSDVQVVLDVWEPEPVISRELLGYVAIGTPHIAGYSYDGKLNGTEMIYQAFCKHFNLEATIKLADLVPPLEDNQLACTESDAWAAIKQLVKRIYDITADDADLRRLAVAAGDDDAAFAAGFDGLRKSYHRRREFHNYEVKLTTPTSSLTSWLATLDFQLAD